MCIIENVVVCSSKIVYYTFFFNKPNKQHLLWNELNDNAFIKLQYYTKFKQITIAI